MLISVSIRQRPLSAGAAIADLLFVASYNAPPKRWPLPDLAPGARQVRTSIYNNRNLCFSGYLLGF